MRLASVNLNKRLGNPAPRATLTAWLSRHGVDMLLAQEPWKTVDRTPPQLSGYRPLDGDGDLFCWIADQHASPSVSRPHRFLQRIELAWLAVHHVYLDSTSASARATQLGELHKSVSAEQGRPTIICGDFNIAPRPIDGLSNDEVSSFNSTTDRVPLQTLLEGESLQDVARSNPPQFTIERQRPSSSTRFRCDLALVSDYLTPLTAVRYEHQTRVGPQAFTDHSGILIDVPVTLPRAAAPEQESLFALLDGPVEKALSDPSDYRPYKTAKNRPQTSPVGRAVTGTIAPLLGARTILDHGCGRGGDLAHYRAAGLHADGWDPHPGFGYTTEPSRLYDLVINAFVLNVLPDPWQRVQAVIHAAGFTRPGGHLLVVARGPEDVNPRAATAGWQAHHDGFWSSETKGTFQKGIEPEEIISLARRAGLTPDTSAALPVPAPGVSQVLLVKPV